jgi:hypothetical protein
MHCMMEAGRLHLKGNMCRVCGQHDTVELLCVTSKTSNASTQHLSSTRPYSGYRSGFMKGINAIITACS